MVTKNIPSRIVNKHDIEANWIKAVNFIPERGEIIVYDIDDNYTYERFKIGDGIQNVNDLPFLNIVQSDWKQTDETAMDFIKNGDNLGEALSKTKLNFPDKDVVADLRIYAELDNFEEALDKLANDWLDESAEAVEAKASILNMGAMFAISGIIAWAVFGVFEMQDQITSSMGIQKNNFVN